MSMKCPACGKNHWGRCTDKSVALWKRMTAGEYVDGDRYLSDSREDVPAREFAREVNRLEKRCAALEAENARLREDKERLDWLVRSGAYVAWDRDGEVCWLVWPHNSNNEGDHRPSVQAGAFNSPEEALDAARALGRQV